MNLAITKPLIATALGLLAFNASAEIRMTVIPERPVNNEPVHVRITTETGDPLDSSTFDYSKSYVMHFGHGTTTILPIPATSGANAAPGHPIDYTYYLGRFHPGSYRVSLGYDYPDSENIARLYFEIDGSNQYRFDLDEAESPLDHSGIWWIPDEPGTSIVLSMSPRSRNLGGGLYAYDVDGNPAWYALAPGQWLHSDLNDYRVKVFRSTGSGHAQPYDPTAFSSEEVGHINLHFVGPDTLQASYNIDGQTRSITLKRFGF